MLDIQKIIFYLTFAKTKLNPKSNIHQKSIHEINKLIKDLKEEDTNEDRGIPKH